MVQAICSLLACHHNPFHYHSLKTMYVQNYMIGRVNTNARLSYSMQLLILALLRLTAVHVVIKATRSIRLSSRHWQLWEYWRRSLGSKGSNNICR